MDDFSKLVTSFGWPGALLIVIVVFLWRVIVRIDKVFLDTEKGADGRPKGWAVRAFSVLEENSLLQTEMMKKLEQESAHKEVMLKELQDGQKEIILGVDRIEDRLTPEKMPPRITG